MTTPSKTTSYVYSLALMAAAVAITRCLTPVLNLKTDPYDLFLGAVVLSACHGGPGPAFATLAASIVIMDYYFMPPFNAFSLGAGDLLRLTMFGLVAAAAGSVSARLKEAMAALEKARDGLETRVRERTADLTRAKTLLEEEVAHRLEAEKELLAASGREQRRLSEDLHDGVCQTLAGLRLLCRELKDRVKDQRLAFWPDLERIESGLGETLSQADVLARGLYPVELEADGLMAALGELAARASPAHRIACRFRCAAPVPVRDSAVATHLYRIAQEAVVNAVKHGKARRASIRLSGRNGRVTLSVTDDGAGFRGTPRRGMGLRMMAHRARVIEADFKIRSRPGGCARVLCSFRAESTEAGHVA